MRDLHTLNLSIHNEYEPIEYQYKRLDVLTKHHCHTSMTHLNTQSLPFSFDEFWYMMNKYKFDIVVLSKTWLKNNNSQLEYVHINDYKSEFKDRESKPEAELVSILKNIRILTFDTMLEELMNRLRFSWESIGVQSRNKNPSVLIGVVYQPSSNETEKLISLERFDQILTEIYIKLSKVRL